MRRYRLQIISVYPLNMDTKIQFPYLKIDMLILKMADLPKNGVVFLTEVDFSV